MINYFRWAVCIFAIFTGCVFAVNVPISLFPIDHYNQNVSHWINPIYFPRYHQNLLKTETQKKYFTDFKNRWLSAWNPAHVRKILNAHSPSIASLEHEILQKFDNLGVLPRHENTGSNFRAHNKAWINRIKNTINLNALHDLTYKPKNRAILLTNTEGRALPTNDVSFYPFTLPGEGYPFDNLQLTSLWAGTPVYVIAKTKDQAWSMILAPDIIAWVPSNTLAFVHQRFIRRWVKASHIALAAIIHTKTPFKHNHHFYFSAYVGSVFPKTQANTLLFPVLSNNGFAKIVFAKIPNNDFVAMPFTASPQHFSRILKTLVGRPYGWGGMYFYNDCSQELRSLYTPFGIWLPRHSSDQVHVGDMYDKKTLSPKARIQFLRKSGRPLMSIVYIKGHVFLYVGLVPNSKDDKHKILITYQNIWGLRPSDNHRRAVIGKSVFLPLLNYYPEDTDLASLASKADFQVSNLEVFKPMSSLDLASLMLP